MHKITKRNVLTERDSQGRRKGRGACAYPPFDVKKMYCYLMRKNYVKFGALLKM